MTKDNKANSAQVVDSAAQRIQLFNHWGHVFGIHLFFLTVSFASIWNFGSYLNHFEVPIKLNPAALATGKMKISRDMK